MMTPRHAATYGQVMDIAWYARARPALARQLRGQLRGTDALLAAGLILAFSEPGLDSYHHNSGTAWAAVGVLGAAAVAWRRAAPRTVWLITTVTGGWLLFMRHGPDWGGLSPLVLVPACLVGLYSLTSRTTRRAGLLATAFTLAALEAGLLSHPVRPEAVATVAALAVSAWAAGESASARTRALRAERMAREVRAAADERARIARELHDIVAHHVSVISLQAGTARLLAQAGTPPDAGLLSGIETASRQAMAELRHTLGVLTHIGGAQAVPGEPGHAPGGAEPPPSLARLAELTAGSCLAVTVEGTAEPLDGPAGPLPAAVELTAYRVIQESLTNVLRHSAARSARVTLRRLDGALQVTVTDDGPARPGQSGGGLGLRGLRERVAAHGGTFHAGPRADGAATGFEVSATLPIPG
jgi:signal transduction histidine kinase